MVGPEPALTQDSTGWNHQGPQWVTGQGKIGWVEGARTSKDRTGRSRRPDPATIVFQNLNFFRLRFLFVFGGFVNFDIVCMVDCQCHSCDQFLLRYKFIVATISV